MRHLVLHLFLTATFLGAGACDLLPFEPGDATDGGTADAGSVDAGTVPSEPRSLTMNMTLVQSRNRGFSHAETAGGRVLASVTGGLLATGDGGRTWSDAGTTQPFQLASRGGSRVYGTFVGTGLRVSDDAGATWTDVTLPATGGRWRSPFAEPSSDGTTWVLAYETDAQGTERHVLLRSTGGAFERIATPAAGSAEGDWRMSAGTGGALALAWSDWTGAGEEVVYLRSGDAWTRVGAWAGLTDVLLTDDGGLLIGVRSGGGPYAFTDDGGETFTEDATATANPRFRRGHGGRLWRLSGATGEGTRVERSEDGGRTWSFVTFFGGYVTDLAETETDVVAMESGTPSWKRSAVETGTGPWTSDALPGFASTFVDVAFAGERVVALRRKVGSPTELYVSDDRGDSWRPGPTDPRRSQCVALSPDGSRVLLGFADFGIERATVRMGPLADPEAIVDSRIETAVNGQFPYGTRQCLWYADTHGGEVAVLAMANAGGTEGALVWSTVIDGRPVDWRQRLTKTFGMPGDFKPRMAYFGLGLTRSDRGEEALHLGVFQYLGGHVTNGTHFWLWAPESMWNDSWFPRDLPFDVGQRPIALSSTTGRTGDAIVALYEYRVGGGAPLRLVSPLGVQDVLVPTHPSFRPDTPLHTAKVAPDGHLWLGTDHGLYRSDVPVASLAAE